MGSFELEIATNILKLSSMSTNDELYIPYSPMDSSLSHRRNDNLSSLDSLFNKNINNTNNNSYYTNNYTQIFTNYSNNYSYNIKNNNNSTNNARNSHYKHSIYDTKADSSIILKSSSLHANDIFLSKN